MLSVVGRRCPAAKHPSGAAAPPYLVIYRQLVDALSREGMLYLVCPQPRPLVIIGFEQEATERTEEELVSVSSVSSCRIPDFASSRLRVNQIVVGNLIP